MGRYEELERLNKLKENGTLSEEEFEKEKRNILNETSGNSSKINQNIIERYSEKNKTETKVANKKEIKTFLISFIIVILSIGAISAVVAIASQKVKSTVSKSNTENTYNSNVQNKVNDYYNDTKNYEDKDNQNTVYTSFGRDVSFCKNMFDGWWNAMTSENKIVKTKSTDWKVYKQQVYPYANLAIKEFYIYPNQEFAIVSIGYDDDGNVINLKFSGISSSMLDQKYDVTEEFEYTCIMYSIPQILKYATDDENLCKYLQDKISYCFDNGQFYFNEKKQGFKFSFGGDSNNYLNLEVCLNKYAQD